MHGDEGELEAAGEEAEHQQHVAAMPEGLRSAPACDDCGWGAPSHGEPVGGGVASMIDSGSTSSIRPANISSALCQENASISACASGENRNWPNEPAAVPAPKASPRQFSGTSLPSAPITIGNEQPARPKPISTPAERSSTSVVGA